MDGSRGTEGRFAAAVLAAALACLVLATAGGAATAPTAITGPAQSVGATTATVLGTVNPNGVATTAYFTYGTTSSETSHTANITVGSGTANVNVSSSLSGLAPGTTYFYSVVAASSAGTAKGVEGTFTTLSLPGAVTGSASSVTGSSATLNGSVDPNGLSTTWYFEYGTSTSYGSKTASATATGDTAVAVGKSVTGLQSGRTYHFRLVATSDAGTTRGGDATFTTSAAPTVVTGSVSGIGPKAATLHGTVTPNGLSTTWYFEYGTTTKYGSKTSSHSAGSGTTAQNVSSSLSTLKVATVYHYRLVASNSGGTNVGEDRTFETSQPPAVQTGAAQAVGADTATLTGSIDPRSRATSWYFDYGTTTSYGHRTPTRSAGSSSGVQTVTETITGLSANTTYHYRLVAKSDAGTSVGADAALTTVGVTLRARAPWVVYGRRVALTGTVPTRNAGEQVTVFAQPFGQGSPRAVATVLTGAGGVWTYLATPSIATAYQAGWRGGTSPAVRVGVRPAISLRRTATGSFVTAVRGGRSFVGKVVQLQRKLADGRFVTVRRVRLGAASRAVFTTKLPRGTSTLRIAMSVNQAGAGFLGGFSPFIVVHV